MLNSHPHLRIPTVVAVLLMGLLTVVACNSAGRRAAMTAVLDRADSLNRNYIPITTDSLLREAADYFDSHGTPNERLRAHYLLGCAYRDMGEAPRAIQCFQDGVACADTAATNCDYRTLGCVYSQMAQVFHQQLLFTQEKEARQFAHYYAALVNDTINAIYEHEAIAGIYILQNEADSAEAILLRVMEDYRKAGKTQASLNASTLLMYVYLEQSHRLQEAKDLIDIYEKESDIFDGNHELPQGRRLFYYYKGRYYESIGQLDSAEYYYRKRLHAGLAPAKLLPLYKGLLNVFSAQHQADSITKYAQLYCETNDSTALAKDMVLTARLSASYNYNRYQRQSLENAREAHAANSRLIFISFLMLLILSFFLLFLRKNRKKHEEQKARYRASISERNRLQEELDSLKDRHYDTIIAWKEQKIASLTQDIERQSEFFKQMTANNRLTDYKASSIVKTFNSKRTFSKGQTLPTNDEWKNLVSQFRQDMPSAYTMMNCLSPLQLQVCILLLLGFEEGEIAYMRQTKPQVINTAKVRANQKLFLSGDAVSLRSNLLGLITS